MIIVGNETLKLDYGSSSSNYIGDWTDYVDKTSLSERYSKSRNNSNRGSSDSNSSNGDQAHINQLQNHLIPIYFTVLGLIIALLLIYVLYKIWRQRQQYYLNNKMHSLPITTKECKSNKRYEEQDNLYSSVNKDLKNSKSNSSYQQNHLMSWVETNNNTIRGGDVFDDELSVNLEKHNGHEGKWSKVENQMLNKQIFSLPIEPIEAVIYSLSDESSSKGWKDLAKHEGFTESDVISISQQIQLTQPNNNDQPIKSQVEQQSANHYQQQQYRQDCIRLFLQKWSDIDTKHNNTKKLIRSLIDIHRQDTALLLRVFLKKYAYQNTNNNDKATTDPIPV